MLVHYIKELLYKHDCVVIPDFGGLIARYEGASIHDTRHSILPPSKRVAFNQSLQTSDGLIEHFIATSEDVSLEEAAVQLKVFVASIEEEIKEVGHYRLVGIGKFYYNEEYSLQFEADEKENFLEESYALPELYFKTIDREDKDMANVPPRPRPVVRRPAAGRPVPAGARPAAQAKPKAAAKPAQNKQRPPKPPKPPKEKKERGENQKPIFLILPILFLIAAAVLTFLPKGSHSDEAPAGYISGGTEESASDTDENATEIDEETPVSDIDGEDELVVGAEYTSDEDESDEMMLEDEEDSFEEESTPEVVEDEPLSEPEPITEEITISTESGRYHVIAGSFSNRANAEKLISDLGHGTILPGGSLIKVSVKSYESRSQAESEIGSLRGTYGSGIWIYKN